MRAISLLVSTVRIIFGIVIMSEAIASWVGCRPSFNSGMSLICGWSAVELGICRLLEKWDKAA